MFHENLSENTHLRQCSWWMLNQWNRIFENRWWLIYVALKYVHCLRSNIIILTLICTLSCYHPSINKHLYMKLAHILLWIIGESNYRMQIVCYKWYFIVCFHINSPLLVQNFAWNCCLNIHDTQEYDNWWRNEYVILMHSCHNNKNTCTGIKITQNTPAPYK
jgi:hypothetical protein